ncbi:hypothetical protein KSD_42370 [Ktedonobacter sp. SOSP1-85]|uniref:serine/threonine protein kinase n=1 Tax=Ktedonobacter sp. SOSP1-85 TaxID=2778367 RepID=UPI0019169116|nr:serine/threonine-protein kinase [Ktedonobacter sp. SOSP1-85]GHO76466.1 hypothetical protein KSD_42370 [Ktedonobacter sp. SOSP1-85]
MAEQGPLSGQKVGDKYVLTELLGEGGFGIVYKAYHLHLQRQQAIKILIERLFQKKAFRERFLREAQTVATLDHPNIIHIDDFGIESTQAYLVMPFIKGGTLQDVLRKQHGFLGLEQIAFYLEQICTALDYAHARGVVHLDLKPHNLLIHDDGRLLLADFGLAHLMKQGKVEGGSSLRFGSPHYMAPEHIRGNPERQSDIFSLGVILYQMLVGRLPFQGAPMEAIMFKNVTEWPPSPRTFRPELSQEVENVLGKALAKRADQRYVTAGEFLTAFKGILVRPTLSLERLKVKEVRANEKPDRENAAPLTELIRSLDPGREESATLRHKVVGDAKGHIWQKQLEPQHLGQSLATMEPIKIFCSYAFEDEKFRDEILQHLNWSSPTIWYDCKIPLKTDWFYLREKYLDEAHIVLLLISPDFLRSNYPNSLEIHRIMEKHSVGKTSVIPVNLRPAYGYWGGNPISGLLDSHQALPTNARPITDYPDRNRAFEDVAQGIQRVIQRVMQDHLNSTQQKMQPDKLLPLPPEPKVNSQPLLKIETISSPDLA